MASARSSDANTLALSTIMPLCFPEKTRFARAMVCIEVWCASVCEVNRRAARRVESRQPHGAEEYQAQRIVRSLELFIQLLFIHPLAVRNDVEAELLHLLDLVLAGRHHVGHRFVDGAADVAAFGPLQ